MRLSFRRIVKIADQCHAAERSHGRFRWLYVISEAEPAQ
jgi:hypothetical protein